MNQQRSIDFGQLDAEIYLTRRLNDHGCKVFEGDTTPQARRERFRSAIINNGLERIIIGPLANGKPERYGEFFERHFGEPLIAKAKGR